MNPVIALTNFEVILPRMMMDQSEVSAYIAQVHQAQAPESRVALLMERYGIKPSQINQRGFENIELGAQSADINQRTQFFGTRTREILAQFYPQTTAQAPDHIVHVTCTGYISPSPAQHLVNDNEWTEKTNVTHAYHMGCYAALPAVRMAEGFVAARQQKVDIVHTELCGLHMDRQDHSPEQLVVQSLFADGHIKYSAVQAEIATSGFQVLSTREQIVPGSQGDMSWIPAAWGMKMTLSREVPQKIGASLRGFVQKMVSEAGYELSDVLKNAVFAVHPGGPKIIDSVRAGLELSEEQVRASREVLFERGNMSSATLPHVWKKLVDQKLPPKTLVVSLAFGPGLTIFGALFETL
jgi:predicted naringenin-chalcone synthase